MVVAGDQDVAGGSEQPLAAGVECGQSRWMAHVGDVPQQCLVAVVRDECAAVAGEREWLAAGEGGEAMWRTPAGQAPQRIA